MVDILFWTEMLLTAVLYRLSFNQQDFLYFKKFPETLQLASAAPFNVIYSYAEYEYQEILLPHFYMYFFSPEM